MDYLRFYLFCERRSVILFAIFNFGLTGVEESGVDLMTALKKRPSFLIIPFKEWLVILGVLVWILVVSLN